MMLLQADIWGNIFESSIYKTHPYPQRTEELKELLDDSWEKFQETLPPASREAFKILREMEISLTYNIEEYGITLGIRIAKELQDFLSRPDIALNQYQQKMTAISIVYGDDMKTLKKYFQYGV